MDWEKRLRKELKAWFGSMIDDWEVIKTYEIKRALSNIQTGHNPSGFEVLNSGLYRCGDDIETASINGAIKSGKLVAKDILKKLAVVKA